MPTSCMDNIILGRKQPEEEEEEEEEDTSLSDTTFSVSSNRNGNTISSTGDLETDSDDTNEEGEEEQETNQNLVDFSPAATLAVALAAASSNSRLLRYGSFITMTVAWGCSVAALVSCDFATHQVTWQDMGESSGVRNPCLESEYDHSSERDRMRSDAYEYFCSALVRPHSIGFRGVRDATHDVCIPLFSFDTTSTYCGVWDVRDFTDASFDFALILGMSASLFGFMALFMALGWLNAAMGEPRYFRRWVLAFLWPATMFQGMSLLMFHSSLCDTVLIQEVVDEWWEKSMDASTVRQTSDHNESFLQHVQDVECSLSTGSKMAISATVLYIAAIVEVWLQSE